MDLPREAIDPREYFLTNFSRLDRDGMADVAAHAFDLLDTHDKATVLAATVLLVAGVGTNENLGGKDS